MIMAQPAKPKSAKRTEAAPQATRKKPALPYTGKELLESLDDGREVWIYGERVKNITTHPAFQNCARMLARLYDALHDDHQRGQHVLTEPTEWGGFTHRYFRAPTTVEEQVAGRDAIAAWARLTYGWLGRSPDYKAAFLGTLGANAEFYAPYQDNARRWYRYSQERVPFINHAIIHPPVDPARRERRYLRDGQRVRALGGRVRARRRREGEQLLPAHRFPAARAHSRLHAPGGQARLHHRPHDQGDRDHRGTLVPRRRGEHRRGHRLAQHDLGPFGCDGQERRPVDGRLHPAGDGAGGRLSGPGPRGLRADQEPDREDRRERAHLSQLARARLQERGSTQVPRPLHAGLGRGRRGRARQAHEAPVGRDRHRVRRSPRALRDQLLRQPRRDPALRAVRRACLRPVRSLEAVRRGLHSRVRSRRLEGDRPDQRQRAQHAALRERTTMTRPGLVNRMGGAR